MTQGVLDLWDANTGSMKGMVITLILVYMTTLLMGMIWISSFDGLTWVLLVSWPVIAMIWLVIVWLVFAAISGLGCWISYLATSGHLGEEYPDYIVKMKKIMLFLPVVISTIISVCGVFLGDIFRREELVDLDEIPPVKSHE